MQSVPQRRSREVAENPAQNRAVEKWQLEAWSTKWAEQHGVSRTAQVLLAKLWEHANLNPQRVGNTMRPRHWQRDGIHWLKVWPSEQTLAASMNCTQRTVRRAMSELRKAGNIERRRRTGGPPENRSGPNRASETMIVVPEPERWAAHRLRIAGTAAGIAQAARTDPQVRATLLTATTETLGKVIEDAGRRWQGAIEGIMRGLRPDVLAAILPMADGPVGIYRPTLADGQSGTLLTSDPPVQDTPKADPVQDLQSSVQDKSVRAYRTKVSSPTEVSEVNTCKNQPNPTASPETDATDRPDWVGLDCCAGETEQASDPAEPTCPVEVKPSQPTEAAEPEPDCPVEGEAERQMAALQFTADERKVIEEAFPDPVQRDAVAASGRRIRAGVKQVQRSTNASDRYGLRMGDIWNLLVSDDWILPDTATSGQRLASMQGILREFMDRDWRELEELRRSDADETSLEEIERQERERQQEAARENRIQGWVEKLREFGVTEKVARSLAEQHERNPDVIRRAIEDTNRMVKAGVGKSAAGLLVSKLNKAVKNKATTKQSEPSEGYSWAQ